MTQMSLGTERRQTCTAGSSTTTSFLAQSSILDGNFPLQTTGLYAYFRIYQAANDCPICSNVTINLIWLITFHNNNAYTELSLLGKYHLNYHLPLQHNDETSIGYTRRLVYSGLYVSQIRRQLTILPNLYFTQSMGKPRYGESLFVMCLCLIV